MRKQGMGRNLPPDLTFEVLKRLPVKTLTRFLSVCRSWDRLISDPIFRKSHHDRSKQSSTLVLCSVLYHEANQTTTFGFSCIDNEGNLVKNFEKGLQVPMESCVWALPTCLDLVCLRDHANVFVCNPATEELITLPPNHDFDFFDVGFGYVPSTREFKVLRLCRTKYCLITHCEILTLGTNIWRKVEDPPFWDFDNDAHFLKGAIHIFSNNYSDGMAVFNLEREEWVDPMPTENFFGSEASFDNILRVLGGVLCVLRFDHDVYDMEIWMLRDYDKGVWVKEYTIKRSQMDPHHYIPVKIEDDGRLLMEMHVYREDRSKHNEPESKLRHYDPQTRVFSEFEVPKKAKRISASFYVDSFISLGSRDSR